MTYPSIISCPRCAEPMLERLDSDREGRLRVARTCACRHRESFSIDFSNSRSGASPGSRLTGADISSQNDSRPSIGSVAALSEDQSNYRPGVRTC